MRKVLISGRLYKVREIIPVVKNGQGQEQGELLSVIYRCSPPLFEKLPIDRDKIAKLLMKYYASIHIPHPVLEE